MTFNNTWINIELITDTTQAFVYLITLEKDGEEKYYIGYKSLIRGWQNYISSSDYVKADKEFITRKIILEVFDDKNKGHAKESFLIKKFNAVKSDKFYNRNDSGQKFNIIGLPKTEKQIRANQVTLAKRNADPEFQAIRNELGRVNMIALNKDPEFCAKRKASNQVTLAKRNADLEFCAKRDAILAKLNVDPEFQAKRKESLFKRNTDPEFCAKRDDIFSKLLDDPDFCAKRNDAARATHSKKVQCIETGVTYCSAQEASTQTGIGRTTISDHCLNKTKNQKWKFTE